MTREEILALPTGKKLDALVADKVMGWEAKPGRAYYWTGKDRVVRSVFYQFSTDISAAWEVLEKPEIMDIYQIGVYPTSFGKWIARPFMPGGRDCTVQAETAPEAICKCVLLAVMDKEAKTK